MRSTLNLWIFLSLLTAPTVAHAAVRHRHVPPAEAPPRQPLTITVGLERGWELDMELHFRALGADSWQTAPLGRSQEEAYAATIPADHVEPPGLEYFIVSRKSGKLDSLIFASLSYPHRVRVEENPGVTLRERILGHHHGRRAGIRIAGDWVDYGGKPDNQTPSYVRLEVSASYLLLALPLKTLRFGYTDQRGKRIAASGDKILSDADNRAAWFELGLAHGDALELDVGGAFVIGGSAQPTGGGRGELRIGVERGTHIALGAEFVPGIQFVGRFRLAWATVPGLPMAASVEVSNYPSGDTDYGVRLIYDVTRSFKGFVGVLRISYQAQGQDGRLTGGASLGYEF